VAKLVDTAVSKLKLRKKRDVAMIDALACLYGDALVRAKKWSWMEWRDGRATLRAVVSPKSEYVVVPGASIRAQLEARTEVTLLLLFRMIIAGNVPHANTNAAIMLG
jgi:hypothetical protein